MTACQRWASDRDDCGGVVCRCLSRSVACRMWAPMDFAEASLCRCTPVVCCRSTGSTGSSGAAHCYLHRQDRPYPQWAHGGTDTPLNPWYHQCLKYNKHPERREYSKCPRCRSSVRRRGAARERAQNALDAPRAGGPMGLTPRKAAAGGAPGAACSARVRRAASRRATSGWSAQHAVCKM